MKLTIGSTTLELSSFNKRWDKIGGVYAEIKIPTTAISYEGLKTLFNGNAEDLVVTQEDGSVETYSGYAELHDIKESLASGLYVVTQYCTATAMHLLNETRKQLAAQTVVIEEQTAHMAALEEASVEQISTLDCLLLEIIPAVITEAVAVAVEEALASNSGTTE